MSLRRRGYDVGEATLSGAIPDVVKPMGMIKQKQPAVLSGKVPGERKKKKRPLRRRSSYFSQALQSRI